MRLGAHVLLPKGFDTHPDAKYPLALFHGHFPADFEGFRPEPPEEELEPDLATRFALPIPGVSTANSQQRTLGIRLGGRHLAAQLCWMSSTVSLLASSRSPGVLLLRPSQRVV